MSKIFQALCKPARWVLIIGGLVYAVWFAVQTALSFGNTFMSVLTGIFTLIIGVGLIALPPVLLIFKKEELAKVFFVFLIGYWVLYTTQEYFFLSDTFASADQFYPVFVGIFLFIIGLGLASILVLIVLEMLLGMKFLRPIINLVAFFTVCACILTGILFIILCAINNSTWVMYIQYALMGMIVLPTVVGFGCLYFFGASEKKA